MLLFWHPPVSLPLFLLIVRPGTFKPNVKTKPRFLFQAHFYPSWFRFRKFPFSFALSFGNSEKAHHFTVGPGSRCFLFGLWPALTSSASVLSQAHGPGGPEELHLLAEGQPRCHRVRSVGLRHVQSASKTPVMARQETAATFHFLFLSTWETKIYLKKKKKDWTNQTGSSSRTHLSPFLSKQHERETNFYTIVVYLYVVGKETLFLNALVLWSFGLTC